MKKIPGLFFLLMCAIVQAQTPDSLDRDNGFSDIHLLNSIDSVTGFVSIFKDPDLDNGKYEFAMFESQYTYIGTKYSKLGEAKINKVFLTTDKDYITEIKVVCGHDSSVLKTLYARYGAPNAKFITVPIDDGKADMSVCTWRSVKVRLIFTAKKYHKKKDSDESEIPDYMYLKYMALNAAEFLRDK